MKVSFAHCDVVRAVAERLRLPYAPHMQDWEIEVADPSRVEEFARHLDATTERAASYDGPDPAWAQGASGTASSVIRHGMHGS